MRALSREEETPLQQPLALEDPPLGKEKVEQEEEELEEEAFEDDALLRLCCVEQVVVTVA